MTSLQSLPWRAPEARGRVVVLGSANVDLTVGVERRPSAGETLLGSSVRRYAGGKGANQAAAAAAAGADTTFLGCVGDDADGEFLLTELRDRHIDVQHVRRSPQPTGTAMIMLTPDGENSIIVSPGANTDVDPDFAQRLQPIWSAADIVVMSLEVPTATVAHVAASGGRTLINAAPMTTLESVTIEAADPLVVNESEARLLLHAAPDEPFDVLATALLERGARSVVVTLGGNGAIVADASGAESIPAYDVPVVDTTGAGDAFVGAVAAELARGNHLRSAVRFGTAMAALSIQRHGAQVSYQRRAAVEAFILRSTKEHGT